MEHTDEDVFGTAARGSGEPPAPVTAPGPAPRPVVDDLARRGAVTVRGTAHTVAHRSEAFGQGTLQVLELTLQRYAPDGRRLPPVPVALRALSIRGQLADGHEVEATGRWEDGTLVADRVRNLTTGSTVVAKHPPRRLALYVLGGVAAFMLLMGGLAALGAGRIADRGRDEIGRIRDDGSGRAATVVVPDVVGADANAAFGRLADAGLFPRNELVDAAAPLGTVVRTEPAAGAQVARGTTVVISVSRGR